MAWDKDGTAEPRAISRVTFGCLVGVAILALFLFESVLAATVERVLGLRTPRGMIAGLGFLNWILSINLVDRMLKGLGLSRSGKTVEVRKKIKEVATPEVDGDIGERVEVRLQPSLIYGLGLVSLGFSLLIAVLLLVIPPEGMTGRPWAYVLIVFFGMSGFYFVYEQSHGKPQAWADATGIWAYPFGARFRRQFVPWSEVSSCVIETHVGTFGEPLLIVPTLMGPGDRVLMAANLTFVPIADQERLVRFIRARLPKTKADPWE